MFGVDSVARTEGKYMLCLGSMRMLLLDFEKDLVGPSQGCSQQ